MYKIYYQHVQKNPNLFQKKPPQSVPTKSQSVPTKSQPVQNKYLILGHGFDIDESVNTDKFFIIPANVTILMNKVPNTAIDCPDAEESYEQYIHNTINYTSLVKIMSNKLSDIIGVYSNQPTRFDKLSYSGTIVPNVILTGTTIKKSKECTGFYKDRVEFMTDTVCITLLDLIRNLDPDETHVLLIPLCRSILSIDNLFTLLAKSITDSDRLINCLILKQLININEYHAKKQNHADKLRIIDAQYAEFKPKGKYIPPSRR